VFYAQSVALASEADNWRRDTVNKMIRPINFLPELDERGQPFQPCPLAFLHPQLVVDALPQVSSCYFEHLVDPMFVSLPRLSLMLIGV
jgi:hypothetical protein